MYKWLFLILISSCIACESADPQPDIEDVKKTIKKKSERKKLTGTRTSYYDKEETQVMSEVDYAGGVRNGKAVDYFKNGQVRLSGAHVDGLKQGQFVYYHEDGSVYRKIGFFENRKHGWDSVFYKSGRINYVVPYEKGIVTEGTVEWNKRYKKIPLPSIVLREVNRIETNQLYFLFASFKDADLKGTRFELAVIGNGTEENPQVPFEPMAILEDKSEFGYTVPLEVGYEIVAKIIIKAVGKTKLGNPYEVRKVFPVVMR